MTALSNERLQDASSTNSLLSTLEDDDAAQLTGLVRIREEPTYLGQESSHEDARITTDLSRFPNESLHSYRFGPGIGNGMVENRKNLLARSMEFMRSKLLQPWKSGSRASLGSEKEDSTLGQDVKENKTEQEVSNVSNNDDQKHVRHVKPKDLITVRTQNLKRPSASFLPSARTRSPGFAANSLHTPSRFSPQGQAFVSTDRVGTIKTVNDLTCLLFGIETAELVGKCVLDFIAPPFREKHEKKLKECFADMKENEREETVFYCGKVVRILRRGDVPSAASLWLKRKKIDGEGSVYIWVFGETLESTVHFDISNEGNILDATGALGDVFGYEKTEVRKMNLFSLIPSLASASEQSKLNISMVLKSKYYAGMHKDGSYFPIATKIVAPSTGTAQHGIQVAFMPSIAGMVTVQRDGVIQSCNDVFMKRMLGYASRDVIGKRNIVEFIPQYPYLIEQVVKEGGGGGGTSNRSPGVFSSSAFQRTRFAASPIARPAARPLEGQQRFGQYAASPAEVLSRSPMVPKMTEQPIPRKPHWMLQYMSPIPGSPNVEAAGGTSPVLKTPWTPHMSAAGITATHKDGVPVPVDIQIRMIGAGTSAVYAVWIRFGRTQPKKIDPSTLLSDELETGENKKEELTAKEPDKVFVLPENQVVEKLETKLHISPVASEDIAKPTSIKDYIIIESMGEGAYGYAKLAIRKNDPQKRKRVLKYVVKGRILVESWSKDPEFGVVPLELRILNDLRKAPHPNIVEMTHFFDDPTCFYIEMDLHGFGMDLFDYIEFKKEMTDDEIKHIFRQVCCAVDHLHKRGIVHRDVKDENIIIDDSSRVRLIDFGSSAYAREEKPFDTFCGTLDYAAPEVLQGQKYTGKPQDIWALGILLYTLVYKENPFYNVDEIIGGSLRISFAPHPGCLELFRRMLNRRAEKRPTISEVLSHGWVVEE